MFGERAKLIRHGTDNTQRDRPIPDRSPSEAIADLVNSAIGRPTGNAFFAAGAVPLICQPKREFQLHFRVPLEL
jgi:hypothetical protein